MRSFSRESRLSRSARFRVLLKSSFMTTRALADTEADSFDLAFVAATRDDGADIELVDVIEYVKGCCELGEQVFAVGEVFVGWLAVDGDDAFAADEADAGSGALAATECVEIVNL